MIYGILSVVMKIEKIDTSQIKDLPTAIQVIELLLEQNRLLSKRVAELEKKVAELSKNSSNSSKSPSSDIVKPPQERRQPGKRKQGGQPGHKGAEQKRIPPDKVDFIEELELCACPDCGRQLSKKRHDDVLIQQVAELVDKPIKVTEYRGYGHLCPDCNVIHYSALPDDVIEAQLLGPKLQALTAYMKGELYASYRGVRRFFNDVLDFDISQGTLANTIKRVSWALAPIHEELSGHIRKEKVLHIDETGWKDRKVKYWVWIFCTSRIALFSIDKSRGSKVLKRILGETFDGAIISDFFGAYIKYANPKQQFCLAHLIRDIKFLITLPDKATQVFGEQLLQYFKKIFDTWHEREIITPLQFTRRMNQHKKQLDILLQETVIPDDHAARLAKRMNKHWHSIFRFTNEPDTFEPTNNQGEQTIRIATMLRRHTQGTRSEWGRRWTEHILTVLQTCHKQNRSAYHFIHQAIRAHYFKEQTPSLLPIYT